jgi:hypothetical protein
MSLTVPDGVTPVVTAISITPVSFFLALEDAVTQEGIGQVSITFPSAFSVYKFDMPMTGAYGWLVPGSGINTPGVYTEIEVALDPQIVIKQPPISNAFTDVTINQILHTIEGILGLDGISPYIKISTEEVDIVGVGTKTCIVLSRNDNSITTEELYSSFTELASNNQGGIFTLGGVTPDESGNIDLTTSPDSFVLFTIQGPAGEGDIGLLLFESEEVCVKDDPKDLVLHGQCEQGIATEDGLPCDDLVIANHPEYTLDDCGCTEPTDQYTGVGTIDYENGQITIATALVDPPVTVSPGDYIWILSSDEIDALDAGYYAVVSGNASSYIIEPEGGSPICEPETPPATVNVIWAYIGALPT